MNRIKSRTAQILVVLVICLIAMPPLTSAASTSPATQASGQVPTTVTKDDNGYTLWTVDFKDESWCVPVETLRYPFDLKGQDPTLLNDASLILTFKERAYTAPANVVDPSWSVALNGAPPDDWQVVGDIVGRNGGLTNQLTELPIPLDTSLLIDGVNNVWLEMHDPYPQPACQTCASTCVELSKVQLRAAADLAVREISPAPNTRNVWPEQGNDSEITVSFTTVVSETTVNNDTFELFTFDADLNEVEVEGTIRRDSGTKFTFVPKAKLLPGVRYLVRLWGRDEALADGRDQWVKDVAGGPLDTGDKWFFWTLPDLQVTVKPVQVLEGMPLVTSKPTVVRTFIRWDLQPNVYGRSQLPTVEVDDVAVTWLALDGDDSGTSSWTNATGWQPVRDPQTASRKREYREFTAAEESYTNFEKSLALDSINFYGFTPSYFGDYLVTSRVLVKDSRGRAHAFIGRVTVNATAVLDFQVGVRAVAAGADVGKTGIVDLSAPVGNSIEAIRAILPVAHVWGPATLSAIQYYSPTTTLWVYDWKSEPASNLPKLYILQELSALCLRTTGCDAMVGMTRPAWLVDDGLTLPEAAPEGALVKNDVVGDANRFTMVHELGHLAHFEHIEVPAGEGFDVVRRMDRRYSIDRDVFDYMTVDPVQSSSKQLWISNSHYSHLLQSGAVSSFRAADEPLAISADPLLLVSGAITESTGTVALWPWYQMEPGEWYAPDTGPYRLVFLDAAGQELTGYTRPFTVSATLQPAGAADPAAMAAATGADGPAFFTFAVPYPATAAKVQIRRTADQAVLAQVTAAASAPTVSITPPSRTTWTGAQSITWQAGTSARYFAVDVSTDGGSTWEALALHLTGKSYTLETASLPNTGQAHVRVAATDGFRTTTATAGPFTIDNPPLVSYVSPASGATGAGIYESVRAGFRDPMRATTLTTGTFTLSGGALGSVPGVVTYDSTIREAIFAPAVPLAYGTTYTARLTTGVKDATGETLPAVKTWTFTTEADPLPPQPILLSPIDGALDVPRSTSVVAVWDEAVNAATLNATTFRLATASGVAVSGAVTYDAAMHAATFTPASPLAADTLFVVTLKGGVRDAAGNTTVGDYRWAFTTGTGSSTALRFTGAYGDEGADSNGDGLYETLLVRAGVTITATDMYTLSGTLVDAAGAPVAWATIGQALTAGTHVLTLAFDGNAIGGHGVDGPYTLTDLVLYRTDASARPLGIVSAQDAYRTFAYAVTRFPVALRFSGLPDVVVLPGTAYADAFNVRDYAHHVTLPAGELQYRIVANSNLGAGVTLATTGDVTAVPDGGWEGLGEVTLSASDGSITVQDSFTVLVGWPDALYLPVVLRNADASSVQATRSGWITIIGDSFETEGFAWNLSSGCSDLPCGIFHWARRDCAANTGQYSAWPFGGGDDGALMACGANYPDRSYSMMCSGKVADLNYVGKAELRAKVWTDLAPGDEVCLVVTDSIYGDDCRYATYYGVCRSGKTNGWEDLVLDLSNVPEMGNLLGSDSIWVGVKFDSDDSGSRPVGAYVDDVVLRICPAGLESDCR